MDVKMELEDVSRREVLRYMGCKGEGPPEVLKLAEEALKDRISPDQVQEITPDRILDVVAEHFKLKASDLTSEKRNKEIVRPRQIAMYLCREMTDTPLMSIAKCMKKKDHSTIIYGIDKITKELEKDEALQYTVEILKKKLNPS